MTLSIESFEGTVNASAITNGQLTVLSTLKGGTATVNGDTSWFFPGAGSKSARINCASGGTDFGYFLKQSLSVTQVAMSMGLRWNALPSPGTNFSKIMTVRNSSTNMAFIRYGGTSSFSGNVYQILDSSGVVKHTSPDFNAATNYFLELVAIVGAGTGRIITNIYEDLTLWDTYDSGTTLNTGSTNFVDIRFGKMDNSAAGFDGWVDYCAYNDGSATLIDKPATASASANAGPDSTLDCYQNWVDGDVNTCRANLDGSQSTWTGGTPTFAWTGPPGVTFTNPTSVSTQAIIPNDLNDQTYTITLTVTVGSVNSSDSVNILVKGAEKAWINNGVWKPARKLQF